MKIIRIIVIALVAALAAYADAGANADVVGKISALRGEVHILRDGAKIPAAYGSELHSNDTMQTGPKARAQVVFSDSTVLTLGRASSIRLADVLIAGADSRMKLDMSTGSFKIISGEISRLARKNFQMRAATATIGIRGTVFLGEVGAKAARFACLSGAIDVAAGSAARAVAAGSQVRISDGALGKIEAVQLGEFTLSGLNDESADTSSGESGGGESGSGDGSASGDNGDNGDSGASGSDEASDGGDGESSGEQAKNSKSDSENNSDNDSQQNSGENSDNNSQQGAEQGGGTEQSGAEQSGDAEQKSEQPAEKPAGKADSKPAGKSAEKSASAAEKPAEQPANQPLAAQIDQPADKPAAEPKKTANERSSEQEAAKSVRSAAISAGVSEDVASNAAASIAQHKQIKKIPATDFVADGLKPSKIAATKMTKPTRVAKTALAKPSKIAAIDLTKNGAKPTRVPKTELSKPSKIASSKIGDLAKYVNAPDEQMYFIDSNTALKVNLAKHTAEYIFNDWQNAQNFNAFYGTLDGNEVENYGQYMIAGLGFDYNTAGDLKLSSQQFDVHSNGQMRFDGDGVHLVFSDIAQDGITFSLLDDNLFYRIFQQDLKRVDQEKYEHKARSLRNSSASAAYDFAEEAMSMHELNDYAKNKSSMLFDNDNTIVLANKTAGIKISRNLNNTKLQIAGLQAVTDAYNKTSLKPVILDINIEQNGFKSAEVTSKITIKGVGDFEGGIYGDLSTDKPNELIFSSSNGSPLVLELSGELEEVFSRGLNANSQLLEYAVENEILPSYKLSGSLDLTHYNRGESLVVHFGRAGGEYVLSKQESTAQMIKNIINGQNKAPDITPSLPSIPSIPGLGDNDVYVPISRDRLGKIYHDAGSIDAARKKLSEIYFDPSKSFGEAPDGFSHFAAGSINALVEASTALPNLREVIVLDPRDLDHEFTGTLHTIRDLLSDQTGQDTKLPQMASVQMFKGYPLAVKTPQFYPPYKLALISGSQLPFSRLSVLGANTLYAIALGKEQMDLTLEATGGTGARRISAQMSKVSQDDALDLDDAIEDLDDMDDETDLPAPGLSGGPGAFGGLSGPSGFDNFTPPTLTTEAAKGLRAASLLASGGLSNAAHNAIGSLLNMRISDKEHDEFRYGFTMAPSHGGNFANFLLAGEQGMAILQIASRFAYNTDRPVITRFEFIAYDKAPLHVSSELPGGLSMPVSSPITYSFSGQYLDGSDAVLNSSKSTTCEINPQSINCGQIKLNCGLGSTCTLSTKDAQDEYVVVTFDEFVYSDDENDDALKPFEARLITFNRLQNSDGQNLGDEALYWERKISDYLNFSTKFLNNVVEKSLINELPKSSQVEHFAVLDELGVSAVQLHLDQDKLSYFGAAKLQDLPARANLEFKGGIATAMAISAALGELNYLSVPLSGSNGVYEKSGNYLRAQISGNVLNFSAYIKDGKTLKIEPKTLKHTNSAPYEFAKERWQEAIDYLPQP